MITTSVTEAAQCLKQGQVLAYPTEAVWGLGCDPYNEQAFLDILQKPHSKVALLAQPNLLLNKGKPFLRSPVIFTVNTIKVVIN